MIPDNDFSPKQINLEYYFLQLSLSNSWVGIHVINMCCQEEILLVQSMLDILELMPCQEAQLDGKGLKQRQNVGVWLASLTCSCDKIPYPVPYGMIRWIRQSALSPGPTNGIVQLGRSIEPG